MINREQQDLENALKDSTNDDNEASEDSTSDVLPDLTCGVEKCKQSQTVWENPERLEKHR